MAEAISLFTLSIPALNKIMENILEKLKTKNPSAKDLELVNTQLSKLIELTHGTGIALAKYVNLLSLSTKAGAYLTEILSIINAIPIRVASSAIMKLIDDRMITDLRRGGIEKIHEYREDYEKTQGYFSEALDHLYNVQRYIEAKEVKNASKELRYANRELDKIVVFINRRVEEQIAPLVEAYRILINSKKVG